MAMQIYSIRWAIFLGITLCGCLSTLAQDRRVYHSKDELIRDYAPAANRLIKAYSTVTIEANCEFIEKPGDVPTHERLVFHANGSLARLNLTQIDEHSAPERIVVAGEKRGFLASKRTSEGPVVLNQLAANTSSMRELCALDAPVVGAATNFYESSILEWLKKDDVRVLKTEWVKDGSDEVLKVWTGAGWQNNAPIRTDWLLLDPSANWVCRGYCLGHSFGGKSYPDKAVQMASFAYEGEVDRVPAIHSAHFWLDDGKQEYKSRKYVVSRIETTTLDASNFTLTSVGLPEVEESVSKVRYYVVGLMAAAAITFGVYMYLRRTVSSSNQ